MLEICNEHGICYCMLENPVSDLLIRTPAASIYRVKALAEKDEKSEKGEDGEYYCDAILEIAADPDQNEAIERADSQLDQLIWTTKVVRASNGFLGDSRSRIFRNMPSATVQRLFPQKGRYGRHIFKLDAKQGGRAARLVAVKNRDWEYFLPLRACQKYDCASSWGFVHLILDYLCIIYAFDVAKIPHIIYPDFLWVDTSNSQLVYLGSTTHYTQNLRGSESELPILRRQALNIVHDFFRKWLRVRQHQPSVSYAKAFNALAKLLNEEDPDYPITSIIKAICKTLSHEDVVQPLGYFDEKLGKTVYDPPLSRSFISALW